MFLRGPGPAAGKPGAGLWLTSSLAHGRSQVLCASTHRRGLSWSGHMPGRPPGPGSRLAPAVSPTSIRRDSGAGMGSRACSPSSGPCSPRGAPAGGLPAVCAAPRPGSAQAGRGGGGCNPSPPAQPDFQTLPELRGRGWLRGAGTPPSAGHSCRLQPGLGVPRRGDTADTAFPGPPPRAPGSWSMPLRTSSAGQLRWPGPVQERSTRVGAVS